MVDFEYFRFYDICIQCVREQRDHLQSVLVQEREEYTAQINQRTEDIETWKTQYENLYATYQSGSTILFYK